MNRHHPYSHVLPHSFPPRLSSDLSTIDHRAGVACPCARSLTYSWPSAENSQKPLPSRSVVAGGSNGHGSEPAPSPTSSCPECAISSYCVGCGCSGGTTASGGGRRATCSASVPSASLTIDRKSTRLNSSH